VRLADFRELVEYSALFASKYRPNGRKVVSISNSGATCVLAADAAEDHGLSLCEFASPAVHALREVLPNYVTARNPIDMTTALLGQPAIYGKTLGVLAEQRQADMIHVGFPIGGEGYDFNDFSAQTGRFMEQSGIPVAVSVNQDWVAQAFRAHQVPVFESERAAMRGLALLAQYTEMRKAALREPARAGRPAIAVGAASITQDEPTSLAELAAAQLPVVEHVLCQSEAEVRDAVARLDGPLVAKGVSRDLTHKSEHGLVRLGIRTELEALQAFSDFRSTLDRLQVHNGGLLLARQQRGHFELAIGAHLDPDYGPVVMVGQGGVLVEALKDVQFLIAPFSAGQAVDALLRLGIAPAFGEVRGMPPVNLHRIAAMLVSLGDWFMRQQGAVVSVDANPVIVARGEASPVIVDAVVIRAGEKA
jgi:acyl-CoA synthetase (NDP forming)